MRQVGVALGASEDAAEKRVARALEKLRRFFSKRGVSVTSALMAGAISAHSVQAAPAALAKTAIAIGLAQGTAVSSSTLTLAKGALKVMAWTKAKTALAGVAIALMLAGGTTGIVTYKHHAMRARAYLRRNIRDARFTPILAEFRAHVWPKESQLARARIEARQQVNDTVNAVTINLKPYVNYALTDSAAAIAGNTENNLAELPSGVHTFGGVPFDVQGIIQIAGADMATVHKRFPAEVDGIQINRKCAQFYVFHGTHWVYRHDFGKTVARLRLHYADDSTRDIEMKIGAHSFDFWSPLFTTGVDPAWFKTAPGTERAWTGSNPLVKRIWRDESLNLYRSVFRNPQPDIAVTSLDYVSAMSPAAPFLVGLTVE